MIYEIDLFDESQIKHILSNYNLSEFCGGSISNPSRIKNNLIMKPSPHYALLNKYCSQAVELHNELFSIFVTKKVSPMYFLWYTEGMKYGYHIDNNPIGGVNAHYSMTCFLSDPSEYEGGELILKVGNAEVPYKLNKGKAIIYSTGIKHKVNPVISGDRKVMICWLETAIQNSFIRNYLIDYGYLVNDICLEEDTIKNGQQLIENLESFRINLMREYGDL